MSTVKKNARESADFENARNIKIACSQKALRDIGNHKDIMQEAKRRLFAE